MKATPDELKARSERLRQERFVRDAAVFVPRRLIADDGSVDLTEVMAEVNAIVASRGMVLADGQVITTPFSDRIGYQLFGDDSVFDAPPARPWGAAQRAFFDLADPHQLAEEPDGYLWWHVMAYVVEPFLADGELIVGLVHGSADGWSFACECHDSAVVYTTRARLVCMSCGYTHLVLPAPLEFGPRDVLSADDWIDLFGPEGARRHEVVDLPLVDVREVENAAAIWKTDRWEEARKEFVFFARTPPDELTEAAKRMGLDPTLLAEAGFEPIPLPPTPAWQLNEGSIDVDLVGNAGDACGTGVAAYVAAHTQPGQLTTAILELFRTIDLLFRARLEQLEPGALGGRPNNPTVLKRLAGHGVSMDPGDEEMIAALRRLRNKLQHSEARFNHRFGLGLCRRAIIFIDAFASSQLGLRTRDVLRVEDWQALLGIPEIAALARRETAEALEQHRHRDEAEIATCPRCGEEALLRPDPSSGAACVHCGHIPVIP
jgi:hypothetical protein